MAIVVVAVNIYRDKKNVGVIFFFWRGVGGKYTLNAFLGFDGGFFKNWHLRGEKTPAFCDWYYYNGYVITYVDTHARFYLFNVSVNTIEIHCNKCDDV